ncbi:MAG: hypothetical protein H0T65_08940, partial [Deltaproteobacteria bacterium]|nr:hypothetical protein [Deltaproteobacteria bacterium]
MDGVFASQRGAILLAALGLVAAGVCSSSRSIRIEPVYANDGGARGVERSTFSPDGTLLLTDALEAATVWDVRTGRSLYQLLGGRYGGGGYAFSPDGIRLAAVHGTVRVIDARTGKVEHQRDGEAFAAAFSPAGDRLLIHGEQVEIWTPATDNAITLPTQNPFDAAWSPDGALVAVASYESVVEIWDAKTGALVASLPHDETVHHVRFVGGAIVTATSRHLRRWDAGSFRQQVEIALPYYGIYVDFAPDRPAAAVILLEREGERRGVLLYDLETGVQTRELDHAQAAQVQFDASGTRLVTGGHGVKLWDTRTGELVMTLALTGERDHGAPSPDGRLLATSQWFEPTSLWDVASRERVGLLGGHHGAITSLAFARADRRYFATASARPAERDETAKLWDRETGKLLASLAHPSAVTALALASDGEWLATGDGDGAVQLWSTQTHRRTLRLTDHEGLISALELTSEGLLSASHDGT